MKSRLPPGLTPLLLAILLCSAPANLKAAELWSSDNGDWALEGWGYAKSQNLGMHFRDIWLYQGNSGALTAGKLRGALDLYWGDARLNLEHEFTFQAMTGGLATGGGAMGFGTTSADRPRLIDIDDITGDGITLINNLDRLNLFFPIGSADIRIGRQAISWGSAWFWKPTDRFSPFSPMDIDPDVKRGVDGIRAEIFFGSSTSLDLVATFERHEGTDRELWGHCGARFRTTIGRYDLAISAARFQLASTSNLMAGLEFTGELGHVGFRGEAALNYLPETEEWDIEAVLGADYHFAMGLTLAGELFYNGLGAVQASDYAGFLLDTANSTAERLARGEAFNIGRYYAGIALAQEVTPLLNVTLSAIGNLTDPSAFVIAGLQWSVVENGRLAMGALIPVGEKPDPANTTTPIPSEFGIAPAMGYAVMKVSF
jgi:hypothetical protein